MERHGSRMSKVESEVRTAGSGSAIDKELASGKGRQIKRKLKATYIW
jgi:hypothetical protein